jgi:hypothetical protein
MVRSDQSGFSNLLLLELACLSDIVGKDSNVHLLRVSAGEYVESSLGGSGGSGDEDSDFARVLLLRFTALMVGNLEMSSQ